MWADPPGGGGNRAPCTRERTAAFRSLLPEERVIANDASAPEAPMVKSTPTTLLTPRGLRIKEAAADHRADLPYVGLLRGVRHSGDLQCPSPDSVAIIALDGRRAYS